MAKITAWLVTVIGLLLLLEAGGWLTQLTGYNKWIIALAVLVIGVAKLIRNYKLMK